MKLNIYFEVKKITLKQSVWLDLIRGISAQLVLIGHLLAFSGIQSKYKLPVVQNFGVLVFFVLSGYLITQTTLLKGREYGFKGYVIDRFSRIFFSFLPALILVAVFDFILIDSTNEKYNNSLVNWAANFLMIQALPFHSLLDIEAYGTARVFWTVSVEWWFYLLFGSIFFTGFTLRLLSWGSLLIVFSCSFWLYYFGFRGNGLSVYWMIGSLLAVVYNLSNASFIIPKWISINYLGLILLVILIRSVFVRDMYDVTIAMCVAVALYVLSHAKINIAQRRSFLRFSKFIASYSYSLYLVHYSLIVYYENLGFTVDFVGIIALYIICNLLSYVFYLLFERRFYLLKDFMKKRL